MQRVTIVDNLSQIAELDLEIDWTVACSMHGMNSKDLVLNPTRGRRGRLRNIVHHCRRDGNWGRAVWTMTAGSKCNRCGENVPEDVDTLARLIGEDDDGDSNS